MSLSVSVMAHRKRRVLAERLADQLSATVTWDRHEDRHETGLRCLKAATGDHHLVIQDDARPCLDLIPAVEQIVALHPESPVGLYIGRVRPHPLRIAEIVADARAVGASLVRMVGPLWGVAVVIPTVLLDGLIASYEASTIQGYDARLTEYFTKTQTDVLYTLPSLVDHYSVQDGVDSLVQGRTGHRVAHWALPEGVSALSVDWSKPSYWPGHLTARRPIMAGVTLFRRRDTGSVRRVTTGSAAERALGCLEHWERI